MESLEVGSHLYMDEAQLTGADLFGARVQGQLMAEPLRLQSQSRHG